jgi:hypothetical protein
MSFFVTITTMCWDEDNSSHSRPYVRLHGPFASQKLAEAYIQAIQREDQHGPFVEEEPPKYYDIHNLSHHQSIKQLRSP